MVVQLSWAEQSIAKLKSEGVSKIDFQVFAGMEHSACPEEIQRIKAWLVEVLPGHA